MSFIGNTPEAAELKRLADAIEQSAKGAEQAALSAKRSASWTMMAAIVSFLGIVLTAAITLGWLDWAKHPSVENNVSQASIAADNSKLKQKSLVNPIPSSKGK